MSRTLMYINNPANNIDNRTAWSCCYIISLLILKILVVVVVIAPIVFSVLLINRNLPDLSLKELHVFFPSKTLNSSTTNTTIIHFNLTIQNPNVLYGLYYKDPLNLTFIYFPPPINEKANVTIGRYTIQGFYQGLRKVKHVQDFVVVQDVFSEARQLREPAKVALLSVDFDARVKFKSIEHKKIHLAARAFVEVNCNTGMIVQNKTIPLDYTFGSDDWSFLQWLICILLIVLYVVVLVVIVRKVCCSTSSNSNDGRSENHSEPNDPEQNDTEPNHSEPLLS